MFLTDTLKKPAANSRRGTLRKTGSLVLRLAIGVGILVYLGKSGQINLSSLIRLFHVWPITAVAIGFLLLDIFMMSIRASLLFRNARLSLSGEFHTTKPDRVCFFRVSPRRGWWRYCQTCLCNPGKSREARRGRNSSDFGSPRRIIFTRSAPSFVCPVLSRSTALRFRAQAPSVSRCPVGRIDACRYGTGHVFCARTFLGSLATGQMARNQEPCSSCAGRNGSARQGSRHVVVRTPSFSSGESSAHPGNGLGSICRQSRFLLNATRAGCADRPFGE